MDSDDFPAEVHAALDLLDQKLSSLRRQLVAMQRPAAQAALHRMQALRMPGYRPGPGQAVRRGSGGFTPRSGGATPRGTPRSGSLFRDHSLGKRRRLPEYELGEILTPLGAPKFVERSQVKTIDTPRVRLLPQTEVKKRQAAIEAYGVQKKDGGDEMAAREAIDALCPGEGSSDEDSSDEAYLARHQQMEAAERLRYEAVLDAATKRNKVQPSKLSQGERSKQPGSARASVARAASAPAFVSNGNGGGSAAAAAAAAGAGLWGLGSPCNSMLLASAVSAPAAAAGGGPTSSAAAAPGSVAKPGVVAAATPTAVAGLAAAATPCSAPPIGTAVAAGVAGSKQAPAPTAAVAAQPKQPQPQQQPQPKQSQQQQQPQAQQQQQQQKAAQPTAPAAAAPADSAAVRPAAGAGVSVPSGPNGLPLVMIPMNAAMAAQMAQMQAAMAAVASHTGKQHGPGGTTGGSGGPGSAAAAAAASSNPLLRPPYGLNPAMAAAMAAASSSGLSSMQQAAMRQAAGHAMAMAAAAASDPHASLPAALQAIIPNGNGNAGAANGSNASGSRGRGRPARNVRPRR